MLKVSCVYVLYFTHNNEANMPFYHVYYVISMKRRRMKLSAFHLIAKISNIFEKEINTLCTSTLNRRTAKVINNAYAIPTKILKANAAR